ncbi:hypothetical protein M0R45_005460 [Rubus argutus]|uniref:Uncharacterized protein n=1 Tax=Rubus argutus TaxID=59490 RepID=A0AAW1YMR6_RUBAR
MIPSCLERLQRRDGWAVREGNSNGVSTGCGGSCTVESMVAAAAILERAWLGRKSTKLGKEKGESDDGLEWVTDGREGGGGLLIVCRE